MGAESRHRGAFAGNGDGTEAGHQEGKEGVVVMDMI